VTHLLPADARQAFTLRIAVVLGRLDDAHGGLDASL
jgi:hypothetical protein